MRLRPRRLEDLPACVRLLRATHLASGYPATWPRDAAAWLDPPTALESRVADAEGAIAGHALLCAVAGGDHPVLPAWQAGTGEPAERLGVVARLFVDPAAQGRGAGSALLAWATQAARARDLVPVLEANAAGTAARHFYARLGWREAGRAQRRLPDGTLLPVIAFVAPERG